MNSRSRLFCVCQVEEEEGQLVLDRNPLEWSVEEVVQFISSTDCCSLANIFKEQVCLKVQRERRGDCCKIMVVMNSY